MFGNPYSLDVILEKGRNSAVLTKQAFHWRMGGLFAGIDFRG